jgi:hypothetical protein
VYDYDGHNAPPRTFGERLRGLNHNLRALAARLKDAIAGVVSNVLGQAIRDALRRLLGDPNVRCRENEPFGGRAERDRPWHGGVRRDDHGLPGDRYDDGWDTDEEGSWDDGWSRSVPPPEPEPAASNRWGDAFRTAAQTGLCWLRTQPCRRPMLTTALVALAAGGAALFAGPTFAACVSIVASVASLLLTADSARTAGEMVSTTVQ